MGWVIIAIRGAAPARSGWPPLAAGPHDAALPIAPARSVFDAAAAPAAAAVADCPARRLPLLPWFLRQLL